MRTFRLLLSTITLVAFAATVPAADLAAIDRSIGKEPAYKSKSPRYCLLVFGPKADARVWLVLDGDRLFVDRDGSGDLTAAGKLIEPKNGEGTDPEVGEYTFKAGDLMVGGLKHKGLNVRVFPVAGFPVQDERVKATLAKDSEARGCTINVDVELPGHKGGELGGRVMHFVGPLDAAGVLQFGASPKEAPVIHIGGPLQVTLYEPAKLAAGRETDLFLAVGTPGRGPGTTAFVTYDKLIPEGANPKIEIEFPAAKAGGPPIKEFYELKERC